MEYQPYAVAQRQTLGNRDAEIGIASFIGNAPLRHFEKEAFQRRVRSEQVCAEVYINRISIIDIILEYVPPHNTESQGTLTLLSISNSEHVLSHNRQPATEIPGVTGSYVASQLENYCQTLAKPYASDDDEADELAENAYDDMRNPEQRLSIYLPADKGFEQPKVKKYKFATSLL